MTQEELDEIVLHNSLKPTIPLSAYVAAEANRLRRRMRAGPEVVCRVRYESPRRVALLAHPAFNSGLKARAEAILRGLWGPQAAAVSAGGAVLKWPRCRRMRPRGVKYNLALVLPRGIAPPDIERRWMMTAVDFLIRAKLSDL
jgi:hypothetical protein